MNSETNGPIAVIAVHGVADQQPGETARAIANMLLREHGATRGPVETQDDCGSYSAFNDISLHVAVGPVFVPKNKAPDAGAEVQPTEPRWKRATRWDVSGKVVNRLCEKRRKESSKSLEEEQMQPSTESADIQVMREQVESYHPSGSETVYQTTVLKTLRTSSGKAQEGQAKARGPQPVGGSRRRQEIHVLEMYWADLSRAGSGMIRLIVEFYQLLFYLPTLGRKCIEFARLAARQPDEQQKWNALGFLQITAERLLVLGIPILNLCLLGIAAQTIPLNLPEAARRPFTIMAAALLIAIIVGFLMYLWRYGIPASSKRWPILLAVVLACAVGGAIAGWRLPDTAGSLHFVMASILWLISAVGILWVAFIYQQRKPGAFRVATVAVVLTSLLFFGTLFVVREEPVARGVLTASLFCTEVAFCASCACWILFGLTLMAARFQGWRAIKGASRNAEARRAVWTVHLTLALPAVLSALLTLALWEGLFIATKKFIPTDDYSAILLKRWISATSVRDFTGQLINLTAGPYFAFGFSLVLIAGLLLFWALIPIVLAEFKIPANSHEPKWLGACLDSAYKAARWSGQLLALLMMLVPVIYLLTVLDRNNEWVPPDTQRVLTMIHLAVGSVVLIFLSGSKLPFKAAGLGFRGAVDISMDVSNWFRLNPIDKNPKARITSRFVSLLRHVCNWEDPQKGPYRAIVLIAHSQGTVIAAEVLRFLSVVKDPRLDRLGHEIPVFLFTMGSPLRQLYQLRFPHQYQWGTAPNPAHLGVQKWVNAYRSGDYVGRALWFDPRKDEAYDDKVIVVDEPDRRERCIGSGAHTKYWDESAPQVAEELDRLIGLACERTVDRSEIPARASEVLATEPKLDK